MYIYNCLHQVLSEPRKMSSRHPRSSPSAMYSKLEISPDIGGSRAIDPNRFATATPKSRGYAALRANRFLRPALDAVDSLVKFKLSIFSKNQTLLPGYITVPGAMRQICFQVATRTRPDLSTLFFTNDTPVLQRDQSVVMEWSVT